MRTTLSWTILWVIGLLCSAAAYGGLQPGDRVEPGERVVYTGPNIQWPSWWRHCDPWLTHGTTGTVVCMLQWDYEHFPKDPPRVFLVSFDDWHNGLPWWAVLGCDCPPVVCFQPHSIWWMDCDDLESLEVCDLLDGGEPLRSFKPRALVAEQAGQTLEVSCNLVNGGKGEPSNPVYVRVYASKDKRITPSDYLLGTMPPSFLSGGASCQIKLKTTLPTDVPPGLYYIGWIIDPENKIPEELTKVNNKACLESYRLLVSAPADQLSLELSAATGGKIADPGEGVFVYPSATIVPVQAAADPCCTFFGWTGTAVSAGKVLDPNGADTEVTVDAQYSLKALFDGPHMVVEDFERYDPAIHYHDYDQVKDIWPGTPGSQPGLKVEDGLAYEDRDRALYATWVDGGFFPLARYCGRFIFRPSNDTHAAIALAVEPDVHGGAQAMAFQYDNRTRPYYSEASRQWETLQNWEATGATALAIWYRGAANNNLERMYVVVEDYYHKSVMVVNPDEEAVLADGWTRWTIPLADIDAAGVMLSRITGLRLGVGEKGNPFDTGTGTLYFDDITLVHE